MDRKFFPVTTADYLAALRDIIAESSAARLNGQFIDTFTASAIVNVYDGLSPDNAEKFITLPWPTITDVAFKLLARASAA